MVILQAKCKLLLEFKIADAARRPRGNKNDKLPRQHQLLGFPSLLRYFCSESGSAVSRSKLRLQRFINLEAIFVRGALMHILFARAETYVQS